MEILESHNLELVGHTDLNGHGDGMQIMRKGDTLYVGHMGYTHMGTSIVDIANPARPAVVRQIPVPENTHSHKVQVAGDILLVNHEQQLRAGKPFSSGLAVYDISQPADPRQIAFLPINGQGIHRMWWTGGRYMYCSVREEGYLDRYLMVFDLSDPAQPRIHSRWWYPGQWTAGGETPTWPEGTRYRAHHVIVKGERAYGGYDDGGLVIFAVDDGHLQLLSQRTWHAEVGGATHTHTGLPLLSHNLLITTDEALKDNCDEPLKLARVFDISDDCNPVPLGHVPVPEGDFCTRGGRFGPHNLHENRPEPESLVTEDRIYLTYFSGGLRVYDVRDRTQIREIAKFVPAPPPGQKTIQLNDVYASPDGLIFCTDRLTGGLFILRLTESAG